MRVVDRVITAALVAIFAGYVAMLAVELHAPGRHAQYEVVWAGTILSLALTAGIAYLRPPSSVRAATVIVVAGAVLQVVALTATARTSSDAYRYVWDGIVQFHGIDPFRYVPQDPHLAHLRTPGLFGRSSPCTYSIPGGCTAINRPAVHTVYPPVAQAGFDLVRLLSGGGHGVIRPFQVAGAVGSTVISALLARRAVSRGERLWPMTLWAFSPVVIAEYGNNGHIDWLAALLALGALAAGSRGRSVWSGILVSAAVLTKIYPGLVAPSLLRRRPVTVIVSAVVFAVVVYLPHVIAVGASVIGFLPGYLSQEGLSTGSSVLLVGAVLPDHTALVVGVVLLVIAALVCIRFTDPDRPERSAVAMTGVGFLVATPHFGWYAGLLLMLVAMTGAIQWLPVALAPTYLYDIVDALGGNVVLRQREVYVTAVVLGVLIAVVRHRHVVRRPGRRHERGARTSEQTEDARTVRV